MIYETITGLLILVIGLTLVIFSKVFAFYFIELNYLFYKIFEQKTKRNKFRNRKDPVFKFQILFYRIASIVVGTLLMVAGYTVIVD